MDIPEKSPVDEDIGFDEDGDAFLSDEMNTMGLNKETIDIINANKQSGMFVSAWEQDDNDIHAKDMSDENEQFLTAAEEGKLDIVRQMLDTNIHFVTARDSDLYTPLHRASYNGHVEVMQVLLDNGADVNARAVNGWTPLHSACHWAQVGAVRQLLSQKADINAVTQGLVTPLHVALFSHENSDDIFHCVRCLVETPGIDLSAVSSVGDTPLILAARHHPRCYELISDRLQRL